MSEIFHPAVTLTSLGVLISHNQKKIKKLRKRVVVTKKGGVYEAEYGNTQRE